MPQIFRLGPYQGRPYCQDHGPGAAAWKILFMRLRSMTMTLPVYPLPPPGYSWFRRASPCWQGTPFVLFQADFQLRCDCGLFGQVPCRQPAHQYPQRWREGRPLHRQRLIKPFILDFSVCVCWTSNLKNNVFMRFLRTFSFILLVSQNIKNLANS